MWLVTSVTLPLAGRDVQLVSDVGHILNLGSLVRPHDRMSVSLTPQKWATVPIDKNNKICLRKKVVVFLRSSRSESIVTSGL